MRIPLSQFVGSRRCCLLLLAALKIFIHFITGVSEDGKLVVNFSNSHVTYTSPLHSLSIHFSLLFMRHMDGISLTYLSGKESIGSIWKKGVRTWKVIWWTLLSFTFKQITDILLLLYYKFKDPIGVRGDIPHMCRYAAQCSTNKLLTCQTQLVVKWKQVVYQVKPLASFFFIN